MGLDMYLDGKKYISCYDDKNESFLASAKEFLGYNLKIVTFEIAYWRKANHIHRWFVQNCQNGVDECQKTNISRKQLEELLDTCKIVEKDHDKAEELLPTQEGFFFGSTEYDKYYFDDIKYTIEVLTKILNDKSFDEMDISYHSSW